MSRAAEVARLRAERPRRPFVIYSNLTLGGIILASWLFGPFGVSGWLTTARLSGAREFLAEMRPWPLRDQSWNWDVAFGWAADLWQRQGQEALLTTLAISVAAIVLAGCLGFLLALPAARNFAHPRPFLAGGKPAGPVESGLWRSLVWLTRVVLVFLRSVPEYLWAFLLLALLGPSPWPMVLALALHNAGILGKLTAEVIENTDDQATGALRGLGASRWQILLGAIFPLSLPRFLLYFFYRWETCVREATVLGMLGMASLGFWLTQARAGNRYDDMLFFILAGALLVLVGDVVSGVARRIVRRA